MKKNIHNNLNNKISNNHFIKLPNDILFLIFQFLTIDATYFQQKYNEDLNTKDF